MRKVLVQIKHDGKWVTIGEHPESAPLPASITNPTPHGRETYLFGWHDGDGPGVWRSVAGIDVIDGPETQAVRMAALYTLGLEKVADLTKQSYSLLKYDQKGNPLGSTRFKLVNR